MGLTVYDVMALARYVNETDLYDECTPAQCMTEDVFDDDFKTYMENTYSDVEAELMTFSRFTQSQ